MPFWPQRSAYAAQCDNYGRRCNRHQDCWCQNEDLRCKSVYLKRRKECMPVNKYQVAMFYLPKTPPPIISPICFKYQHQCYHDNDCECEYGENLYCKQLSIDTKGLCLTSTDDLPSWFTPFFPTYKPPTTTSPNPVTTPTSPATTTKWQCENLGARCVEDTDCSCEHSNELWCVYFPEMQDRYCLPEEWDPTDDPPISSRGTQPPPISERCRMFAKHCSSHTDCFCEESDDLRCAYVHEEKGHFCLPDDWTQGGPPTHEHPPSTTKPPPPTTKPLPTSITGSLTFATNLPSKEETSRARNNPWNPAKFGTSTLDGGSGQGGNPYTETPPITKSPWNLWGTKTLSVGKTKGDRITLTASKKLTLNIPVESLQEVINELDEKKLIK